MQVESLGEFVKVRADFSGGSVRPLMFRLGHSHGGRVLRVERVNASWTERPGGNDASSRVCFSVQADGATYFLSLIVPDMIWRVEKVVLEG